MIEEEKVKHIANLANLKVENIEKMQKQLYDILKEIDKILKVEINEEPMISPSENKNKFNENNIPSHVSKEELFSNSKNSYDKYIKVPKVIE